MGAGCRFLPPSERASRRHVESMARWSAEAMLGPILLPARVQRPPGAPGSEHRTDQVRDRSVRFVAERVPDTDLRPANP